ncbi:nuclear transport factor 2 family protein [Gulosibacter molinativorax]|uniref:DUF4440 domain-containing protein n=1 Tax=Gulosibacter molinativorax TaxID=256821 RepID=A0ABT7C8L4_9MICO|nr:nuclear transport factor 2 family protein [Gulosibacter molinativorax]MDJ1371543.1 DUF4440 domain-containing protein [Gulosibacter molinativorax]QUY62485.1 Ketosteroid isomerase [Gulosibacter molinativorax]
MTTNADNVAAHYQAAGKQDLPGMLAILTPETAWTEAAGFPTAGTYVGPDAIVENVFGALQANWDNWDVNIAELVEQGDVVVAIGAYTATNKATGKSMHARTTHVWRFEDGVAVSFEQIADSAMVRAAMTDD